MKTLRIRLTLLCAVLLSASIIAVRLANAGIPASNGDVNGDGVLDLSDGIYFLQWLFLGGPEIVPFECPASVPDGSEESEAIFRNNLVGAMKEAGAQNGIPIDPQSVSLLSVDGLLVVDALPEGFKELSGPRDLPGGAEIGLLYIGASTRRTGIPPGFYKQWLKFDREAYDRGDPDALRMALIGADGTSHDVQVEATIVRPTGPVERWPVQVLSANEGIVSARKYVSCPDIDLLALWCFDLTM